MSTGRIFAGRDLDHKAAAKFLRIVAIQLAVAEDWRRSHSLARSWSA